MSELRKAFELWAVKEELDITSVDFTSGSIRATDHHGNQVQFCYEETETTTAWYAWQEQQKKFDEALLKLKQKYLELNDQGNDYEDPVSICQAEGVDTSIRILEKALQGATNA